MSYTNFFRFQTPVQELKKEFLDDVNIAVKKYKDSLRKGKDSYLISEEGVILNGHGVETFFLTPRTTEINFSTPNAVDRMHRDGWGFCSTGAQRGYDNLVCVILLIGVKHYPFNFTISSNGIDWRNNAGKLSVNFEYNWGSALEYVESQFGYEYACFTSMHKSILSEMAVRVLPDGTRESLPEEVEALNVIPKEEISEVDAHCKKRTSGFVSFSDL